MHTNSKSDSYAAAGVDVTAGYQVVDRIKPLVKSTSVSYTHLDVYKRQIEVSDQIAKVSIVGAGMIGNPGVAAAMFEALYDAGININMISTSEIKVSVLVDESDADRAVQVIHDKFFSGN